MKVLPRLSAVIGEELANGGHQLLDDHHDGLSRVCESRLVFGYCFLLGLFLLERLPLEFVGGNHCAEVSEELARRLKGAPKVLKLSPTARTQLHG